MRETPGGGESVGATGGGRLGLHVTLGTAVAVDSPYQDELGDGVRCIAEDTKNVEVQRHAGTAGATQARLHAAQGRGRVLRRRYSATGRVEVGTAGEAMLWAGPGMDADEVRRVASGDVGVWRRGR